MGRRGSHLATMHTPLRWVLALRSASQPPCVSIASTWLSKPTLQSSAFMDCTMDLHKETRSRQDPQPWLQVSGRDGRMGIQHLMGSLPGAPGSASGARAAGEPGAAESPRACGQALPGCPWGRGRPQPLPRGMAPRGEDAPALHPSGWSEKAGEGLHGLQAGSIGTANPNPSRPPFPNAKFSQNIPKAALRLAKSKRDGL